MCVHYITLHYKSLASLKLSRCLLYDASFAVYPGILCKRGISRRLVSVSACICYASAVVVYYRSLLTNARTETMRPAQTV